MKKYDPNKPLISIHIPKTGGAGLREILKSWFSKNLFLHYFDERHNLMPRKHSLAPNICIHGHFNRKRGFGIEHYYPEANQFITFLRDPFEILISRYFFVKKNERNDDSYRDGKELIISQKSNDYLKEEIMNENYHPNILDYFPTEINLSNYKSIINSFMFIGFTDAYQSSVNRLSDALHLPRKHTEIINASKRFDEIDPYLRTRFMETHLLEYKVYSYARKVFPPHLTKE